MALNRRTFVKGAAIMPFAVWLEQNGWAQTTTFTRYNARSAQGIAMLKTYAAAVKKMQNPATFAEGNTRSWLFQWYTHQVKGEISQAALNKANEIKRIYGTTPSTARQLALDVWNTCQSHLGQPENYFLPWHRMYVMFFEAIIRQVSGDSSFTLPYWNYTAPGPDRAIIPPQFRMKNDATFGPLFVEDRNPWVNNGEPIDKFAPSPLNLDSLKQCKYGPTSNTVRGFNETLDFGLHGNVHVNTGGTKNMGRVPWAAKDPVFWLHHCNIDRLWASWNAAGRPNPNDNAFKIQEFTFVDGNGNRVKAKIGDVLSIAPLHYKYDALEPVPACPPSLGANAAAAVRTLVATKAVSLPLGPGPVRMSLEASTGAAASVPLGTRIEKLAAAHRLYLVVSDLKTDGAPGTVYDLYLETTSTGKAAAQFWVGSINFFAAEHHHEGNLPSYSFDITDLAKRLKSQGKLAVKAELMIAPETTPAADAKPVVGKVSLVEQ